jgi:(p)ppGpp synthase/HD superfamily hydrolase
MTSHNMSVEKAIRTVSKVFAGQLRKDGKTPAVSHSIAVALIVARFTKDSDIIAAALLHDTIEDTAYSYNNLKRDFGEEVAKIVSEVSEDPKYGWDKQRRQISWYERKVTQLKRLERVSLKALMVEAADKIHNLFVLQEEYEELGKELNKRFGAPLNNKLWYYGSIARLINRRMPNSEITKELVRVCKDVSRKLLQS